MILPIIELSLLKKSPSTEKAIDVYSLVFLYIQNNNCEVAHDKQKAVILVINCGSSSLKYEIYHLPSQLSLGKGTIERIGESQGKISQQNGNSLYEKECPIEKSSGGNESFTGSNRG